MQEVVMRENNQLSKVLVRANHMGTHESGQIRMIFMFPLLYLFRHRYNKKEQDLVRVLRGLKLC